MNNSGFSVVFYIVPIMVFGPIVLTILYKFGIRGMMGLPSEIIAKRRRLKREFEEARRRRGFV
jgi:uncharacterized membrane protein